MSIQMKCNVMQKKTMNHANNKYIPNVKMLPSLITTKIELGT
jgi:hypothetical protein